MSNQGGTSRKDKTNLPVLSVSPPMHQSRGTVMAGPTTTLQSAPGHQGVAIIPPQAMQQQAGVGPSGGQAPSVPSAPTRAGGGRTSPVPVDRRLGVSQRRPGHVIAPGQPVPAARQKDKFVPLPDEVDESVDAQGQGTALHVLPPADLRPSSFIHTTLFEDLPVQPALVGLPGAQYGMADSTSMRGRVTFYCVSESFDRPKLEELLKLTYPAGSVLSYPDVYYVEYIKGVGDQPGGDVFFFDYGVVACWGMTKSQEMTIVRGIARQCQIQPLPDKEVETDEFSFNFTITEKPHVQNDTVTLHKRFAQDHKMKLAISYALAQSTKLSVYEKRVVDIVLETKELPESLAQSGTVDISSSDIAKLIGKVFLQKSAVNLLSSVLDTPEFLWHAPDLFQTLYTRVEEYLELPARVELLNSRFTVLQEMLDMLRDHQNNYHSVRLEWIVIWLIVVEVVVGLFELLGLFGIVGVHE